MRTEDLNEAAFRRLIEEGPNKGNLAVVDEVVASHCKSWVPVSNDPIVGPDGSRTLIAGFRSAFPDLRVTVDEIVTSGPVVVARVTASGTQRGEFLGHPPTGRPASWPVVHWARFVEARLVEDRVTFNLLGVLEQLGLSGIAA